MCLVHLSVYLIYGKERLQSRRCSTMADDQKDKSDLPSVTDVFHVNDVVKVSLLEVSYTKNINENEDPILVSHKEPLYNTVNDEIDIIRDTVANL